MTESTLIEAHNRGEHIGRWLTCPLCMDGPAASPSIQSSPPAEDLDLEQRFKLKESVVRLRRSLGTGDDCSDAFWPSDVEAVLEEIDRLMIVNGQIAKLLCDAQDQFTPDSRSASLPTELNEALRDFANYVAALTQGRPLTDYQFANLAPEVTRLSGWYAEVPTDLRAALEEFDLASQRMGSEWPISTQAIKERDAARSRLEGLFREQRGRTTVCNVCGERLECTNGRCVGND